jgi:hypothetical protein
MDEFLTHSECFKERHRHVLRLIPVATWDVRKGCLQGVTGANGDRVVVGRREGHTDEQLSVVLWVSLDRR